MFETLAFIGFFVGISTYQVGRKANEGRLCAFSRAVIAGCLWPLFLGDIIVTRMQEDDEEPEEKVVLTD